MSMLGRYRQQSGESRKRLLDYTRALEDDEELDDVTAAVTPSGGLTVTNIVIDPDGKIFSYFASGGVDGVTYKIDFTVETTGTQIFEDEVEIEVEDI